MINTMKHITIGILCLLIGLSSCSDRKLAGLLRDFRNSEIVTDVAIEMVREHDIVNCIPGPSAARLVIYHDSLACSSCQINHLYGKIDLFHLADSLGSFDVLTIFSPKEEEYDNVMKELMQSGFPYPVYVDSYREFIRANAAIPSDSRFHTFLLDCTGHPVFAGDPCASREMWNLFEKALYNVIENGGECR